MTCKHFIRITVAALLCVCPITGLCADEPIEISREAKLGTPPTPITILGFTGEVANVLKFDLTVMGFIAVPEGSANYILSGNNNGNVQAMLTLVGDPSKSRVGNVINAKAGSVLIPNTIYQGSNQRILAHRVADDVVLKITGVNGIAETKGQVAKITLKAESGSGGEIYVEDFDGHDPVPATQDGAIVAAPCWVPGHFALFYTSYKRGPLEVIHQDLSSGDRRIFAAQQGMVGSVAVSPNGQKVVFVSAKSGSANIYVADVDGGNIRQLTMTKEENSSPCWSPDGQWICFASKVDERRALSKVSVNGGPLVTIRTGGVPSPTEPDWSPDGRWIAFTSQSSGFDICVVPAQGGTATVLVAGEDPSWSPNSRTLIFVRRGSNGKGTLSLLDVPTKQVKDVPRVPGSASNSQPSWAR